MNPTENPTIKTTTGKHQGRNPTVLMFGAPGSGKGTQGMSLGSIPRFFHMACGEVFRQLDTRTPLGREFVSYSSKGLLVPDEITVRLWKAALDSRIDAHQFKPDIDILVLDGIPRNVAQAELMEKHIEVIKVFHLSCPDRAALTERLRKRALKDNRLDDANSEVIERRIRTYEDETKPILEFYSPAKVTNIDATRPPAQVMHDILSRVLELPKWQEVAKIVV